jgi:hypothetical protein
MRARPCAIAFSRQVDPCNFSPSATPHESPSKGRRDSRLNPIICNTLLTILGSLAYGNTLDSPMLRVSFLEDDARPVQAAALAETL